MKSTAVVLLLLGGLVLAACGPRPIPAALVPVAQPAAPGDAGASSPQASPAAAVAAATPDPLPAQELRYALAPLGASLDPQAACSPRMDVFVGVVYETLLHEDGDYNLGPSLARDWEVSQDSRTFTFTLESNVFFHDGAAWNPTAARQNLDRIAARGSEALPAYLGTDAVDAEMIRVRFAQPYPTFPRVLTHACLAMLSPRWIERAVQDPATLPVGTGPFAFDPGQSWPAAALALHSNRVYTWGLSLFGSGGQGGVDDTGGEENSSCRQGSMAHAHTGPAFLDRLIFQFMPEPGDRAAALEARSVDAAEDLAPADADRLSRSGSFWVATVPLPLPGDATADPIALRRRSIDIRRLSPQEIAAAPEKPAAVFNASQRWVNCLSYGASGRNPGFYDTDIRPMP